MLSHSVGHKDCPACQARSLVRSQTHLADIPFRDAFKVWLASKTVQVERETNVRYLTQYSVDTYEDYAWALDIFFGDMPLREIHDGHLRTYQELRAENSDKCWKRPAGQNRIRKEISMLLRILRLAKVWNDDLTNAYSQLPQALTDIPRALDPQQQAWLLSTLQSQDLWTWIYHYCVLALRACASTHELRLARLEDVDLRLRTFRVGPKASKNKFRNRTIPLEKDDAIRAAEYLMKRASSFGSHRAEHFLFPFGFGSRHANNPEAPMSRFAILNQWKAIRKEAGVPWLRPYDLRHTAITRMAEQGKPIQIIMAFAGHISPKMQQHYTTISMQAKREAAQSMPDELMPRKLPQRVNGPRYQIMRSA